MVLSSERHQRETKSYCALQYCPNNRGEVMTELDRVQLVEHMFPDWREHLNDGKVIDHILEELSCHQIVLNRCSRPSCDNVARPGLKTCTQCAATAARYMRTYERRKGANAKKSLSAGSGSNQQLHSSDTAQLVN